MNLKRYLLQLLLSDKEIIEELIKIDNGVQCTMLTYERLLDIINYVEIINDNELAFSYDFITDGEIETIISSLLNYSVKMNLLHINRKYVGLSSWLVARINEYKKEQGFDNSIELIIDHDYKQFTNSSVIVICGFSEFIEGISELFEDKKIIKLEM